MMISTIKKAEFIILQNQKSVPPNEWKWVLSASKKEIDAEFEYWTQEDEEECRT
jgi:hypothetical protein